MIRRILTPFGLAALACLILAGWALWSGGILDGPIARQVRTASVYAAPGTGLDSAAAERVIGNRRLVVIMLRPGADLSAGCDAVKRAAAGTLVLLLKKNGDTDLDGYGCSLFAGSDEDHFGDALVAEQELATGLDEFVDRPLDAVKVVAVKFDQLVEAGVLPGDARTVSPSLPRYLIAIAAVAAVLAGSVLLYVTARRAGRVAAGRRARLDDATDSRSVLSATTAVVAQQIIDLDPWYSGAPAKKKTRYRRLASDYSELLDDIAVADRADETDYTPYTERAEALAAKFRTI